MKQYKDIPSTLGQTLKTFFTALPLLMMAEGLLPVYMPGKFIATEAFREKPFWTYKLWYMLIFGKLKQYYLIGGFMI